MTTPLGDLFNPPSPFMLLSRKSRLIGARNTRQLKQSRFRLAAKGQFSGGAFEAAAALQQ
jgi:hypothetical protein